jgi:hypothetical protein
MGGARRIAERSEVADSGLATSEALFAIKALVAGPRATLDSSHATLARTRLRNVMRRHCPRRTAL